MSQISYKKKREKILDCIYNNFVSKKHLELATICFDREVNNQYTKFVQDFTGYFEKQGIHVLIIKVDSDMEIDKFVKTSYNSIDDVGSAIEVRTRFDELDLSQLSVKRDELDLFFNSDSYKWLKKKYKVIFFMVTQTDFANISMLFNSVKNVILFLQQNKITRKRLKMIDSIKSEKNLNQMSIVIFDKK
ncbi:hypothetical protein [Enterococcus lactis]|uniref:hypothetical protein n=1 Tax=Enterococcus lactis TaxID=357441 RepID=UPI0040437D1E